MGNLLPSLFSVESPCGKLFFGRFPVIDSDCLVESYAVFTGDAIERGRYLDYQFTNARFIRHGIERLS